MRRGLVAFMALATPTAFGQAALGRVTGTVVDELNRAIPGAVVTIEGPMPTAGASADVTGRFVLGGVPPGTYTLRIQVTGFKTRDTVVDVADGKETSMGRISLAVAPVGVCVGKFERAIVSERKPHSGGKSRILDITREVDTAIGGVDLTLRSASGDLIGTVSSDESGRFEFDGVAPGDYQLSIRDTAIKVKLKVRSDHELKVQLTWKRAAPGQICL